MGIIDKLLRKIKMPLYSQSGKRKRCLTIKYNFNLVFLYRAQHVQMELGRDVSLKLYRAWMNFKSMESSTVTNSKSVDRKYG